jgi:hypothetical protein
MRAKHAILLIRTRAAIGKADVASWRTRMRQVTRRKINPWRSSCAKETVR